MWIRVLCTCWLIVGVSASLALADGYVESSGSYSEGETIRGNRYDTSGNLKSTLGTLLSGEDQTNDVMKVEQRFSYLNVTGDVQVKASSGFLHTITCSSDAGATPGTIIVYDNTAESGTIIWTWTISATEIQPRTLTFDVSFATGLYVGYTTTADVTCTVSYR